MDHGSTYDNKLHILIIIICRVSGFDRIEATPSQNSQYRRLGYFRGFILGEDTVVRQNSMEGMEMRARCVVSLRDH
jgi:hypothetical protein